MWKKTVINKKKKYNLNVWLHLENDLNLFVMILKLILLNVDQHLIFAYFIFHCEFLF